MCSNNKNTNMKDRFFNVMFPVGGGAGGAFGAVVSNVTWIGIGEMALQAGVFALVGGLIGWIVKRVMDTVFKKK